MKQKLKKEKWVEEIANFINNQPKMVAFVQKNQYIKQKMQYKKKK